MIKILRYYKTPTLLCERGVSNSQAMNNSLKRGGNDDEQTDDDDNGFFSRGKRCKIVSRLFFLIKKLYIILCIY